MPVRTRRKSKAPALAADPPVRQGRGGGSAQGDTSRQPAAQTAWSPRAGLHVEQRPLRRFHGVRTRHTSATMIRSADLLRTVTMFNPAYSRHLRRQLAGVMSCLHKAAA